MVGERPPAWEYLLYSYSLVSEVEKITSKYLDHRMKFAMPSDYMSRSEIPERIRQEQSFILATLRTFNAALSGEAQQSAFGAPGEPGRPEEILHIARRYAAVYEYFLDWAARLRGYSVVDDDSHELFAALAMYADQPVQRMHDFPYELRDLVDPVTAVISSGENVELSLVVALEIPTDVTDSFLTLMSQFRI